MSSLASNLTGILTYIFISGLTGTLISTLISILINVLKSLSTSNLMNISFLIKNLSPVISPR